MRGPLIRNWLPRGLRSRLWGDREKFGLTIVADDPCWKEWENTQNKFYDETQRGNAGTFVNDAGYKVMRKLSLGGSTVLEIGAGDIRHDVHWNDTPDRYILADIRQSMNEKAEKKLVKRNIEYESIVIQRDSTLPIDDSSVDMVVSFYSLEHIYPLQPYLDEVRRILKPGGKLVGAIPAEGGLAWGLGRFLTARRWFKKHTKINPDKIICWEHPNFADEILRDLDNTFDRLSISHWPFPWLPLLDANLVIRFVYRARQ